MTLLFLLLLGNVLPLHSADITYIGNKKTIESQNLEIILLPEIQL